MRAEDVLRLQEMLYRQYPHDVYYRGYIGYRTWVAAGKPPMWIVRVNDEWVKAEDVMDDGD